LALRRPAADDGRATTDRRRRVLTERTFDAGVVTINCVEGPASGRPLALLQESRYAE
jgi:hypothetical protein